MSRTCDFALPTRLTVYVKFEHIAKGKPGDPSRCPIALALGEQYPLPVHGTWMVEKTYAKAKGIDAAPFVSPVLTAFVERFDSGETTGMEPFKLALDGEGC